MFKLPTQNTWEFIENELKVVKLHSISDLQTLISKFNPEVKQLSTLHVLKEELGEDKIVSISNAICKFALKLPQYFRTGILHRISSNGLTTVEYKRSQVLCLLCHMFLCTMEKTSKNLYWVDFSNWLTDGRNCAVVYLRVLLEYFYQSLLPHSKFQENDTAEEVLTFSRYRSSWFQIESLLNSEIGTSQLTSCIELKFHGSIGDDIEDDVAEVDFANADIGFGISGTQEEIMFGSSPELCIAMLFTDTLEEDEVIVITGARCVAKLEGYGLAIRFGTLVPDDARNWKKRKILAMDALPFDGGLQEQLEKSNLQRELLKAYCGFSAISSLDCSAVATGHWGCGAFGGDKELKGVIQLIAAFLSKINLHYYCFGDQDFFEKFQEFLDRINRKNVTIKQIWDQLNNTPKECSMNILHHVLK